MHPLWEGIGNHPNLEGLEPEVCAEVLLTVGILISWIGSKEGIEDAQESAKNLITESIELYETLGDSTKVAACRAEIAYCYFREGALSEARIMLTEALQKLTAKGNTRARALLKLVIVEWSASRYKVAHELLTDNAALFRRITDDVTRGTYHNVLGVVLRHLAESDPFNKERLLQQALKDFKAADHHFQSAKNKVFGACVKNNVGLTLFNLRRFKEAHSYLEQARRFSVSTKNKVQTAVIDESRAQVFLAERKLKEAETVARSSVHILDKSDHQGFLADALITYGTALARLGKREQAQFALQRAIKTANEVGALTKAGIAALTLIEEIEDLAPDVAEVAYDRASEWLASSQSKEVLQRVIAVSKKIRSNTGTLSDSETATETLLTAKCDLTQEKLKHERELIRQALTKVDGRLTRAASLLGTSYQSLPYIIEKRHPELLKERSPIRRRPN
jgi:tetratricopeptide (TPR) repeat protein